MFTSLNKRVIRKWSEWSKRGSVCSQSLNKLVETSCAKCVFKSLDMNLLDRGHILMKTNWLCNSKIQLLIRAKFPFVDGLHYPAITGTLVAPAISEFVQIINTGNHLVCLSTISCRPGTMKVHDSLFQRVSPIAIRHSCRLLMHTGGSILFSNEKVQK